MLTDDQSKALKKLIERNIAQKKLYTQFYSIEFEKICEIIIKATNPILLPKYIKENPNVLKLLGLHFTDELEYLKRLSDEKNGIKITLNILKNLDDKNISYFSVTKIFQGLDTIFGFIYDHLYNLLENQNLELNLSEESHCKKIINFITNDIETKLIQQEAREILLSNGGDPKVDHESVRKIELEIREKRGLS